MSFVSAEGVRPKTAWALPEAYRPPGGKRILILLPCSKIKPYRRSQFHRSVDRILRGLESHLHRCTISEIMGVVPREVEDQIPNYDTYPDERGVASASSALRTYLLRYGKRYAHVIIYATSRMFRRIARAGSNALSLSIELLPREGTFAPRSAFFEFRKRLRGLRRAVLRRMLAMPRIKTSKRVASGRTPYRTGRPLRSGRRVTRPVGA
jgi:predicted RNA-binding protein